MMMWWSPTLTVLLFVLISVVIVCRGIDAYWKIRGFLKKK